MPSCWQWKYKHDKVGDHVEAGAYNGKKPLIDAVSCNSSIPDKLDRATLKAADEYTHNRPASGKCTDSIRTEPYVVQASKYANVKQEDRNLDDADGNWPDKPCCEVYLSR